MPRDVFLLSERVLEVFFHTSNIEKFLQARLVFERVGLQLQFFRRTTEPYAEAYELGKERLLENAIDQVESMSGRASIFFVEDTSLRIEALSTVESDFPGLAVKEWFADTSFEDLDGQLSRSRRGRRVIVKSDIALHLPDLSRPLYFHGETTGKVAKSPPTFEASIQHPWLTPNTFNGWFIPDGAARRMGELSVEESLSYDFRVAALMQLIDRVEEYTVALNLQPPNYARRSRVEVGLQATLWSRSIILVVGRTCAGKTTFAERASEKHGYRFLEASAILKELATDMAVPELSPFDIAKEYLSLYGFDAVAKKVIEILTADGAAKFVISGFRTIEELDLLKRFEPKARVVLIDASERTRYERFLKRGRHGSVSFNEFRELDDEQGFFGLLRVVEDFADVRIENEDALLSYLTQVDAVASGEARTVAGVTRSIQPRATRERSQTYHTLSALLTAGRPLDCREIEEATQAAGHRIRYNNANKVLKRIPGLARRIEGTRVQYEILSAGRSYLQYLERDVTGENSASLAEDK
ncbi:MAG: non-canonical purine NTP pyrophosphatase [Acidobacteriota bacterium]